MSAPVFANVILRSKSGRSALRERHNVSPRTVDEFLPAQPVLEEAEAVLKQLGFEIDVVASTHITITGRKELFERVFVLRLMPQRAPWFALRRARRAEQVSYRPSRPPSIPEPLAGLVETVEFPGPITYFQTPAPPPLAYDHLRVAEDVARDMDALKAHARGINGTGIRLAMVDSGFMTPQHPYYNGRGYNIQPLVPDPADPTPNVDGVGHGTGIAACGLAVAPRVTFTMFKIFGNNFAAAFTRAATAAVAPHVITCSWGVGFSPALQLAINNAVANGIVVFFACGNGGPVGWPGSEPAVISVGGAFIRPDDSLEASTFASSGTNANNPGRQAPDLVGIVGQAPSGIFIALPTQPGSSFDASLSGGTFPNGDTTGANDGWLVASGTSSSSPMVAATAALAMEANPALVGNPAAVRAALTASCVDVTNGVSAAGQPAGPGNDLATGAGLVQAYRAVRDTDLWLRDNPNSDVGLVPTHNRRPAWPPFAHWISPDIKVFPMPLANPQTDFASTAVESPVFNQDNFVYVQVRNRGRQPTGMVTAGLYYADPATNLLFPSDWNDGQSGNPAAGSLAVGGVATNEQTLASVAAGAATVLPQPFVWRPPDPSAAIQTQTLPDGRVIGHFCLLARLESADDPIIFGAGGQASVINDNNIGMANQQVYSAPPGHMFFFAFYVRGARRGTTRNDVLFDLSRLPRRAEVLLKPDLKEIRTFRVVNGRRRRDEIRLTLGKRPSGLIGLTLKANQRLLVNVMIHIPPGVREADYEVSVVQRVRDVELGGLTLTARAIRPLKAVLVDARLASLPGVDK